MATDYKAIADRAATIIGTPGPLLKSPGSGGAN